MAVGLPFGAFGLEVEQFGGLFTGAELTVSPGSVVEVLEAARANGMRVTISLAGLSKSNYQNPDETFSRGSWEARLDRFVGVDFSEFVADGTVLGNLLIDDLGDQHWGGVPISNAELDDMARYSKRLWPAMATIVRARPSKFQKPDYGGDGSPYHWEYLDTAWDQYSARMGPVAKQIDKESAAATAQGLGLVVGLNVLTGGDGSSGIPGPDKYASKWAMSLDELREYGSVLIGHPHACAFTMWTARYDYREKYAELEYKYFRRPEIAAVMGELSQLADQRTPAPCQIG